VPPDHSARIVSILRNAGNHNCTCVLIAGCDHSFQLSPNDNQQRLRERYNFDSFKREYSQQLYRELVVWLDHTLGFGPSSKLPSNVESGELPVRAVEQSERDAKTDFTPQRLHLAPGIQVVESITDKQQTTGVKTLEGEIGPLLLGHGCQAHFIDMPAGMYCEEHPHSNESIIYTVRGQWVLCSKGRRHLMKPGTLFHFAPNTPTGYEVPFADDAFILIFKGQRLTKKEEDFINYLKGLATRLEREHEAGVPYLLSDLPEDHPANQFAKQVNPKYGK
jgi:quercetin dioxygenase-like cupin family protein